MFCQLEDCYKEECHHCFPVLECSVGHEWCSERGRFKEIFEPKKYMVTGCAGFIGSHVCESLLRMNYTVIGVDNMDSYYKVDLKKENIRILSEYPNFHFVRDDIRTTTAVEEWKPSMIIHLASLAGVRNSFDNPKSYIQVNIEGFVHILEEAVKNKVSRVVYASSSSVYGLNSLPFSECDALNNCNSPYACSKLAMESYAKMYHQTYGISCIGLRFFTVYGPRGRPDMVPYKFMNAIRKGEPIDKHGDGSSSRDYTFIDDIVVGILAALRSSIKIKCEIYNLGNSTPVTLNEFIETCEKVVGKKAIIQQKPDQLGDVPHTLANIEKAFRDLNYSPQTKIATGLVKYLDYLESSQPEMDCATSKKVLPTKE